MTPTLNDPSLWLSQIPRPKPDGHKYDRGCAVVFGGDTMTGAARLAATACMRMGAGVCVVVAPTKESAQVYRSALPAHIIVEDLTKTEQHIEDPRRSAVLIGPGGGAVRASVLKILKAGKKTVLDADAITAFADAPGKLFAALHAGCVLTPHEGEFKKLFPGLDGPEAERAAQAAEIAGCIVLLKGKDSPIAQAGRDTLSHAEGAPHLATAGSGDVLAGMIAGLMAQGMEPYEATAAAAYIHRMAGRAFGAGLVASDLPDLIPFMLKDLGV